MKEIDAAIESLDWFISKEMTVGQRYTNEGQKTLDALAGLRSLRREPVATMHESHDAVWYSKGWWDDLSTVVMFL